MIHNKIQEIFKQNKDDLERGCIIDVAMDIVQEICNTQARGWWDGCPYADLNSGIVEEYLQGEGYTAEQIARAIENLKKPRP